MKHMIWIMLSLSLAACGGGGGGSGGGGSTPDSFLDPDTTQTFSLTSFSSEGGAATATTDSATGQTITVSGIRGQFNTSRDRIDFEGNNGSADILSNSTDQVALFNAKPGDRDPFLGVIGVVTPIGDLPQRNSVSYQGNSSGHFVIIDGDAQTTYVMTSNVTVTANFVDETLDLLFDDFSGTSVTGAGGPVEVSDIGTLEVDDANLSGGTFSGGTADFTRSQNSTISNDLSLKNVSTITSGTFFGDGGAEAAGVVIIEDGTNNLSFTGGFVAD